MQYCDREIAQPFQENRAGDPHCPHRAPGAQNSWTPDVGVGVCSDISLCTIKAFIIQKAT